MRRENREDQMKRVRRLPTAILLILCMTLPLTANSPEARSAPQQNFLILISNDDGFTAPGIRAMAAAMQGAGEVIVAAPNTEQSGKGHSLTLREPIGVFERRQPNGPSWWAIEASPASCVMLALESLLGGRKPDLVISGINRGDNMGLSVYVSGTLGAAREAAFAGIPAIAVSMDLSAQNRGAEEKDFAAAAAFVRQLVDDLRAKQMLKPGLFLNVNAPAGEIKGSMVVRMNTVRAKNWFERREHPANRRPYFWSMYEPSADGAEGTDVWAVKRGFVSITPMMLDNGDAAAMEALRAVEKKAAMSAPK